MIHYNYSPSQLERKATELLTTFDPQRLKKAKPISERVITGYGPVHIMRMEWNRKKHIMTKGPS